MMGWVLEAAEWAVGRLVLGRSGESNRDAGHAAGIVERKPGARCSKSRPGCWEGRLHGAGSAGGEFRCVKE